MKFWRKNDGLTLVELIVSIAIGTMIFAATTTVFLLGFRIHHRTTESITQQYTARTVMTMLEQMTGEGSFNKTYRAPDGSWKLGLKEPDDDGSDDYKNVFKTVFFSYSSVTKTIYSGDYGSLTTAMPILENVLASYITLKDNVVTISLEDESGTYKSSVYCRTVAMEGGKNFDKTDHRDNISGSTGIRDDSEDREELLTILNSQVGSYGGIINHETHAEIEGTYCAQACKSFSFFSQWWIGGYENNPSYSAETPWCACFVSWGLRHVENLKQQGVNDRWFANVDNFMAYFTGNANKATCWKSAGATPVAGDLIFFNMISDERDNPSHMGVVLSVADGKVTTIEGNSADMVAVREYPLGDPRILGYGDPWAAQKTPQSGQ